jgi:hypothetical protein
MAEDTVWIGEKGWNDDPAWVEYIRRFENAIIAIAMKFATDDGLRDDCAQEARMALLTVWPENVAGYEAYACGEMDEEAWNKNLDRYCRNVVRNSVLSYLDSIKTGNWYHGRTRRNPKAKGGKRRMPARYLSLHELVSQGACQIDEKGDIHWLNLAPGEPFDDMAEEDPFGQV